MKPLHAIAAGVGIFGFGLAAGFVMIDGYSPDPMFCSSALTAEWHFVHSPLDDEGFSESVGDFRHSGWKVETKHDGLGDHVIATCNAGGA